MTSAADIFEQSTPPIGGQAPPLPATGERPSRKKAAKKRGGRREPVAAQAQAAPAAPPAERPKRARKARAANGTRKPRAAKQAKAMKLDFATAMAAVVGLKEADTKIVTGIVSVLQTVNKKSRQRVLDAVGRIFA